ncbi:Myc-type, basic helix-loop-helix (bHLH) domain-containing protein [Cynara cardunculus var. scolymus]|uniref:Myc-type, basic helix-loop-helix (BHLH) domain-containing protein n=1 Tax=Cynara cardunculus var. scolymus TaxID=59895 RepID=A0A103XX82_CYNCS|nr:Myc-type, basic helix-loop-helix (bHLH) domain-containing protein [Cynara cardunculus var. scolymus]
MSLLGSVLKLSLHFSVVVDSCWRSRGGYLETHDFLQPLERVGNNVAREGNKAEEPQSRKSLPPTPPTTVEHILPGGIGTYSISHISCLNQSQRIPKPEEVAAQSSGSDKNDENSNCSSYTGSGFSLWEESAVKKGKTGKENIAGNRHVIREGGMKIGGVPWMTSMERPSQSSSAHNHPSATISSLSSSRSSSGDSCSPSSAQKNPSFVDMLNSAKSTQEDEDEEEEEEEFVIKKEPTLHYNGVLSVKVDTAHHDQKPNTPRSKHSATEQRRRSKINDRFSMLRELIPHGDQKRDKASFLLEVIDYIHFLQEKVNKYEDSCLRGWNNEPPANAIIPWVIILSTLKCFKTHPDPKGMQFLLLT